MYFIYSNLLTTYFIISAIPSVNIPKSSEDKLPEVSFNLSNSQNLNDINTNVCMDIHIIIKLINTYFYNFITIILSGNNEPATSFYIKIIIKL